MRLEFSGLEGAWLRIKQRASEADQGPDHHTQTRRCCRGSWICGKVKTGLWYSDPVAGRLVKDKLKVLSHMGDSF